MEELTETSPKCCSCSSEIRDGDLVLRERGAWYHVRCARAAASDGASETPPAVLCVICRTGISSVAELASTGPTPAHVGCQARRDRTC